jgi:hypothetical protein
MRSIELIFNEPGQFVDSAQYKGNGAHRKANGIEITRRVNHIRLNPVGVNGKVGAIFLDIPLDKLDATIKAMIELRAFHSSQV